MCSGRCSSIRFVRTTLLTALAALTLVGPPAAAQMQIPNPLIRPRSLTPPGTADAPGGPGEGAGRSAPPAPALAPAAPPIALPGSAGAAVAEDPYTRSLAELKERFSGFYVSAIVGKQAVLRRLAGARSNASASSPGAIGAAVPIGGAASPAATPAAQSGRSDALMISDGELLDSVGNSGALVAKITGRQVIIFHVQETMVLPGGKLIGKRAVIFAGDVENSGGAALAAIVLEKPDPLYKRMITVETRTRSASGASGDSGSGAAAGSPGAPAAAAAAQ